MAEGWHKGLRAAADAPLTMLKGRSMGAGPSTRARLDSDDGIAKGDAVAVGRMPPRQPGSAHRLGGPPMPPPTPANKNNSAGSGSVGRMPPPRVPRESPTAAMEQEGVSSPRGSVKSLDLDRLEAAEVEAAELLGESVQVFVRVRPHNGAEEQRQGPGGLVPVSSLHLRGTREITCSVPTREPQTFTFDQILWQTPQTEVFEVAGMPMVENCMAGYNSSIFAYGQTGAGKTHTMTGVVAPTGEAPSEQRGIAPRVFEYLFERISKEEDAKGRESVRYSCRCSFLEIYNETITDLLNPVANGLQIREDQQGCFVEGLSQTHVQNEDDVLMLMRKGAENRHVGETRMNRESSRSHSVFTCIVEKSSKSTSDGVTSVIVSRLNLIDLAGSERISTGAMGGSQAQGTHFKEAVHINKSLTTLGRVISELVEAQRLQSRGPKHIPYRDSRLTFLLQDSLGGNAKTMIIANVSPSTLCAQETMTTLQFVQRAKRIRNKAHINLDYRGDVAVLQKEIIRLNKTISDIRQNNTEAAFQESAQLREQLKSAEKRAEDLDQRVNMLTAEGVRFRRERARMEERLTFVQKDSGRLEELVSKLMTRTEYMEQSLEHQALTRKQEVDVESAIQSAQAELLSSTQQELQCTRALHLEAQHEATQLDLTLRDAEADCTRLKQQCSTAQVELADAKREVTELQSRVEGLEQDLALRTQTLDAVQADLGRVQAQLEEAQAASKGLEEELKGSKVVSKGLEEELEASKVASKGLEEEVSKGLVALEELREQVAALEGDSLAQRTASEVRIQALDERNTELAAVRATLDERIGTLDQQVQALDLRNGELEVLLQQESDRTAAVQAEGEAERARHEAQISELQALLAAEQAAHSATQATMATTHTEQLSQAHSELATVQEQLSRFESDLAATQAQLAESQAASKVFEEESKVLAASLASKVSEVEVVGGQARALEEQLREAQVAGEARAQEVSQLQSQVQVEEARCLDLTTKLDDLTARLQAQQVQAEETAQSHAQQITQLQHELEDQKRDIEARVLEMEGMVAVVEKDKAQLVQEIQGHQADLQSLQGDHMVLTQQHETLSQQHDALTQQLKDSSCGAAQLEGSLGELRQQLQAKDKELAASSQACTDLASQLSKVEEELNHTRQTALEDKLQAKATSKDADERLSDLQRQLITLQGYQAAQVFELNNKIKQQTSQLEAAAKELAVKVGHMERLEGDLATAKQSLAAYQESATSHQLMIAERDRELTEVRRKAAEDQDAAQLTIAKKDKCIEGLKEERDNMRSTTGDQQQHLKTMVETTARQTDAFHQIKRLIDWAITPPSSARSSIGIGGADGTPRSAHDPITAPTNHHTLPGCDASPSHASHTIALMRLRSSLSQLQGCNGTAGPTLDASDNPAPGSPGNGLQSPHTGGIVQSPYMRVKHSILRASQEAGGAGTLGSPRRRGDGVGATSLSLSKMGGTGSGAASLSLSKMAAGSATASPRDSSVQGPVSVGSVSFATLDASRVAMSEECDISSSPRAMQELKDQSAAALSIFT